MSLGTPGSSLTPEELEDARRRGQEMVDHGGQVVARSDDGREPVYADDYPKLYEALERLGIPIADVTLDDVPHADEFFANL